MNRILFREAELGSAGDIILSANDYRARHLCEILKAQTGHSFEAGILNTEISGQFNVTQLGCDGSMVGYFIGVRDECQKWCWQNLSIAIGILRPPTLKRLLRDLASAGVAEIALIQADLCEGDYCNSHIWEQLEQLLILGAQQGRIHRLPSLLCGQRKGLSLNEYLAHAEQIKNTQAVLPQNCIVFEERGQHGCGCRAAASSQLATKPHYIMALGPERGWTVNELLKFRNQGFTACSFGSITLRAELAAHLALALYLRETQSIR